jgi:hypothetical protein
VNSNKLVSWLKPGMVATVRSRFKVQSSRVECGV